MPLMEDFVQKPGASDDFLDALIPWLQSPIEPEVRQQLSNAIDHALRLLDQKSWDSTELGNHDYRRFLTLPLCSAFLSGEIHCDRASGVLPWSEVCGCPSSTAWVRRFQRSPLPTQPTLAGFAASSRRPASSQRQAPPRFDRSFRVCRHLGSR